MKMRQRRTFCHDKGFSTLKYNNYILFPTSEHLNIIKRILTDWKVEMHSNTIIVWGFNTPLLTMNTSSKLKISKKTLKLKLISDQMDLTDILEQFLQQQ